MNLEKSSIDDTRSEELTQTVSTFEYAYGSKAPACSVSPKKTLRQFLKLLLTKSMPNEML